MSPPVADSTKDDDRVEKKLAQRRINKPLIEKRRRARINECLAQLKSIVLEVNDTAKSTRPSKLEKADILEMTVEFIQKRINTSPIERSINIAGLHGKEPSDSSSKEPQGDYLAGYAKCIEEISKVLEQTDMVNETIKRDVVSHICQKLRNKNNAATLNDSKAKSCDKFPIIPLKKRKLAVESNEDSDVIDLSMKSESAPATYSDDHSKLHNLPATLDASPVKSLQDTSDRYQFQTTNSQMPVGLLCGGQLMLLVQVSPNTTPKQFLVQSMTSQLHQLHNHSFAETELTQAQTLQPTPATTVPTVIKSETKTEHSSPAPNTNPSNLSNGMCGSEIQSDCFPASSAIHEGNQDVLDLSGSRDVWRPW